MNTLGSGQIAEARRFLAGRLHGDGARGLEEFLGLNAGDLFDLSASMNPVAPDYRDHISRELDSLGSYPDSSKATASLAEAIGIDERRLILTNGGAEAIALVSHIVRSGWVCDPDFALYRRHITRYDESDAWWASNPNNPTGRLLDDNELPKVVDEAFYQLATGAWSRGDFERGSFVVGSLTKIFALPGLRVGYLIAPGIKEANTLRLVQPRWALNSIAASVLPELIKSIDLKETVKSISRLRSSLTEMLEEYGLKPHQSSANYLYVPDARGLFETLLRHKILIRDTSSFGLEGGMRIAVPNRQGLGRIENALFSKASPKRSKTISSSRGSLMVVGTTSDSGKSTMVTALCRVLADRGYSVAPFKAQNMSLNSAVTRSGHEIGRAQARQAQAARVEPEVAMNPILLKPTSEMVSQVVVNGQPLYELNAKEYQAKKRELFEVVVESYSDLASRFEVVLLEGAGSPAEINLLDNDIVNLGLARRINCKALLIGDIDRGGVFASLFGTIEILPPDLARHICGFAINKFRGDADLLEVGIKKLKTLTGRDVFGVVPYILEPLIDAEDSLALSNFGISQPLAEERLDVVVVRLPRISNFTDFDPLLNERSCSVRLATTPGQLGSPDLIIIPGSKSTIEDLTWLRTTGFADAITTSVHAGSVVLGICGGYQMLGREIHDDIESRQGLVAGLGMLEVRTKFLSSKVTLQRSGTSSFFEDVSVSGYQIHQGRVVSEGSRPLLDLFIPVRNIADVGLSDGAVDDEGRVFGTTLHGIFENDGFREKFLGHVASLRSKTFTTDLNFSRLRESQIDFLAKYVAKYVDVDAALDAASIFTD